MAPQAGHVVVQRLGRVGRRVVGPEGVDEAVGADPTVALERQQRQQRAAPRARHVHQPAAHPQRQWTEHVDAQR